MPVKSLAKCRFDVAHGRFDLPAAEQVRAEYQQLAEREPPASLVLRGYHYSPAPLAGVHVDIDTPTHFVRVYEPGPVLEAGEGATWLRAEVFSK